MPPARLFRCVATCQPVQWQMWGSRCGKVLRMAGDNTSKTWRLPTVKVGGSSLSVAFLGYALVTWWSSSTNGISCAGGLSDPDSLFAVLATLFDALALVCTACLSSRIGSLRSGRRVAAIACLVVVSSVLAGLVAAVPVPVAVIAVAALVTGAAKALSTLVWMEAFCSLNLRGACVAFVAAYSFSKLLGVVPPLADEPVERGVAAVVGLVGVLAVLYATSSDGPASEAEDAGARRWSFPLHPTLLMGAYSFAYSFVLDAGFGRITGSIDQEYIGLIVRLCVLAFAVLAFARFDVKVLSVVSAPIVCAGLLCTIDSFSWAAPAATALVALGFYCMSTFIYLLLFNISFRYGVNPLWLFGFSRAARAVGTLCAGFAVNGLGIQGPGPACDTLAGVLVVVVVAAAVTLAAGKGFATTWGIRPIEDEAAADGGPARQGGRRSTPLLGEAFDDRLSYIAYVWGLTKREEEVLGLLARGMGVPDIERELLISNGTVRNHVQHVYKKLGLHSRDDVRAFMADPDGWGKEGRQG